MTEKSYSFIGFCRYAYGLEVLMTLGDLSRYYNNKKKIVLTTEKKIPKMDDFVNEEYTENLNLSLRRRKIGL
jgi:hypothetical protein